MCACFVLPALIVVISASFTSEQAPTSGGFSLLRDFTLDAYKSAFSSGTRVLQPTA